MPSGTITTDAVGRCEAVPELATVEAVAIGEGETAGDARAMVEDHASTLRESITDVRSSTDRIRIVDLQVRDTDMMFDPVTETPFQATERLCIECVPESAESIVVDVANAGGQIQTVEFQLHEDKREELKNRAINSAMERAREKAEHMAASEWLAVGAVKEATTKEVNTGFESIVDDALGSESNVDLQPTPISVSERVEVMYELVEE